MGIIAAASMTESRRDYLNLMAGVMDNYAVISPATRAELENYCIVRKIPVGQNIVSMGRIPDSFFFVCRGILRMYTLDSQGREYTKIFFSEGSFGGSMPALLRGDESSFDIEALEESIIVEINHAGYRALLEKAEDLKWYHIRYIEKNWIMEKEPREVALALDDAGARYHEFLRRHPDIAERIPLRHIASNLGITPTQLSRIRKNS